MFADSFVVELHGQLMNFHLYYIYKGHDFHIDEKTITKMKIRCN